MTDKELRRLSRDDLIELLLAQSQTIDDLRTQLAQAEDALNERRLQVASSGSIAEAALKVNQVFEAAQAAADQYLLSVQAANAESDSRLLESEQLAAQIIRSARRKADGIVADAQRQAEEQWSDFEQKAAALIRAHAELRELAKRGN